MNKTKPILFLIVLILFAGFNSLFAKSTFSGDRLRSACLEYVQSIVKGDCEINVSSNIQNVEFAENDVTAQCVSSENSLRGNCYVTIEFLKDEKVIRKVNVPVQVKVFSLVPVSISPIRSGGEFSQKNLKIERKEITNIKDEDIINLDVLFGQQAKRSVNQGVIITKSMVDAGYGIRRGEKVVIIAIAGAISVKSTGTALNDAEPGQAVRVKRDGINAVLNGTVSENKLVIINLN